MGDFPKFRQKFVPKRGRFFILVRIEPWLLACYAHTHITIVSTLVLRFTFTHTVPHPEILRPFNNVTKPLKKTATLSCLALSYGALTYDWKRLDGSRISSLASQAYIPKRYLTANFVTVTHQLTIPNLQLSDEGWYCCVATNTNGNSEQCVWLEVDSKS